MFFDAFCSKFIRPPRTNYSPLNLGPSTFNIDNSIVNRHDFIVKNKSSIPLHCSLYISERQMTSKSCVLYLHCNTGTRLDVKPYLKELIPEGFSVCSFDFAGCGISGGDYISLGHNEQYDVEKVLDYLKDLKLFDNFFLWGRSMGAVTSLFYISNSSQNLIKGMVLDSSFISLKRMTLEYVNEMTKLPKILLYPLISLVNKMLKEKINLGFDDFELKEQMNYLDCKGNKPPEVLFLASKRDKVVKCNHSEELLKLYPGKNKSIKYINESHEEDRTQKTKKACVEFFKNVLGNNKATNEFFGRRNSFEINANGNYYNNFLH